MSARLLWIAFLVGAAASPAPAQSVVFLKRAAEVGDQNTKITDSEMTMKISMVMSGTTLQQVDTGRKQHREFVIQVRDADKDGATSISFQITAERNTIQSAVEQTSDGKLVGDVFLVTRNADGGPATVTAVDGSSVDDATIDRVRAEANPSKEKDLFDPAAGFGDAIPARATVGETIHIDRDRALKIFDGASTFEMMTLTLKSVEGDGDSRFGVFDVVMRFSISDPALGARIAMDLSGTISVLTTSSWLRAADLRGPLTITGGREQVQIKGTGKMVMKSSSTFTRSS